MGVVKALVNSLPPFIFMKPKEEDFKFDYITVQMVASKALYDNEDYRGEPHGLLGYLASHIARMYAALVLSET